MNNIDDLTTKDIIERVNKMDEEISDIKAVRVVCTNDVFDCDETDAKYELPRVSKVSKHGFYDEFVVMKVESGKIHIRGLFENDDDDVLTTGDLSMGETICLYRYLFEDE